MKSNETSAKSNGEYTGYYRKIIQIHHQSKKDGSSAMVAQKEINSQDEMRAFAKETALSHPLPEGSQWLFCGEKSKYFIGQAEVVE